MLTPRDANRAAVGEYAKQVREQLLQLGMRRCSLTLVYRQGDPAALRPSWYELFWRWLMALFLAHRAGAESLLEDLLSRVAALRAQAEARLAPAPGALAGDLERAEAAHSEIVRSRFRGDGLEGLRRAVIEDLAAKRVLLATVTALLARDGAAAGAQRAA